MLYFSGVPHTLLDTYTLHRSKRNWGIVETKIEILKEAARWRARDVSYWSGSWENLEQLVPRFQTGDFAAGANAPANPHLKSVIRLPLNITEKPIPVGVVSNGYSLDQHSEVVEKCFVGLRQGGNREGVRQSDKLIFDVRTFSQFCRKIGSKIFGSIPASISK